MTHKLAAVILNTPFPLLGLGSRRAWHGGLWLLRGLEDGGGGDGEGGDPGKKRWIRQGEALIRGKRRRAEGSREDGKGVLSFPEGRPSDE